MEEKGDWIVNNGIEFDVIFLDFYSITPIGRSS